MLAGKILAKHLLKTPDLLSIEVQEGNLSTHLSVSSLLCSCILLVRHKNMGVKSVRNGIFNEPKSQHCIQWGVSNVGLFVWHRL